MGCTATHGHYSPCFRTICLRWNAGITLYVKQRKQDAERPERHADEDRRHEMEKLCCTPLMAVRVETVARRHCVVHL